MGEKFFRTDLYKKQMDGDIFESSLGLTPLRLSDGDDISVGKNTLTYVERDLSSNFKKRLKQIEYLKSVFLLPGNIETMDSSFVNKSDGSRFIELKVPTEDITYFVKFRTLKIGEVEESTKRFETISTSQCVFGYGYTKARLKDGTLALMRDDNLFSTDGVKIPQQSIEGWDIDNKISMYEIEALYRKVSFMNVLVSNDTNFNRVILNTPRMEYYLFCLDFFAKRFLSKDLLKEWFNVVDKRTDRLNKLTINRLDKRFLVILKSPLEEIRSYMIDKVKAGIVPSLEEAFVILGRDKLWFSVINVKKPISWSDLAKTAIAVEELRNSFETGGGTVIVKSPKQEGTFYRAEDIAKRLHSNYKYNFNLFAMYPHERIFIFHDTPKKTLLSNVSEPMPLTVAKKVISQYHSYKK